MMKAFFSRTLLALVAAVGLLAGAQGEELRTIRIGVPDQSAGSKAVYRRARRHGVYPPSAGSGV
nr:alkanesulfonates-binding protein [Raoultella sp. NCTC 9187]